MKKVIGAIAKANKIFKMIEDGDRICVGVSGGKDSMCLLLALNTFRHIAKKEGINFTIVGIHMKLNLCAINYKTLKNFWSKQDIEFHLIETKMGDILKQQMKKGKIQCSLCSKMKKAILIENAKKLNCNKVAMGHHADDAIETFFLNLINEGRIATFKPKMFLDKTKIMFIRPLITCREKDIIKATKKLSLPILPCGCPMEGFTQRDTIKAFINKNFYQNKKWANAYQNFYTALFNGNAVDLWFIDKNKKIKNYDLRNDGNKQYKERRNNEIC